MRRDTSEERRRMDDEAHDLDAAMSLHAWWCPDCERRVYGLGVHWGGTGLCETSAPMAGGGGEPRPRGEAPLELIDHQARKPEPDAIDGAIASGSVPLTEGGEQ